MSLESDPRSKELIKFELTGIKDLMTLGCVLGYPSPVDARFWFLCTETS